MLYYYIVGNGNLYIVMDFCEGGIFIKMFLISYNVQCTPTNDLYILH